MPSARLFVKLKSSFQARIAGVLILLLLVVIGALTVAVKVATNEAVRGQAGEQLQLGTRLFERLLDTRGRRLRDGVQLLAADFGFRDAVASGDSATIRSALINHGARISASDMFLLGLDGTVMASSVDAVLQDSHFPYDQALRDARRGGQSMIIVPMQGQSHLLVETQVLAPRPIARVVVGFVMDAAFAQELRQLSNLEVSFLSVEDGRPGQLVSTRPAVMADSLVHWTMTHAGQSRQGQLSEETEQRYLNQTLVLAGQPGASGGQVIALLQSPLDAALNAFAPLDQNILLIGLVALLASLMGALLLARSVSQPVQALALAAERIGHGDYQTQLPVQRSDELGVLAIAINRMQRGIAEREVLLAHNALHNALTGLPNRALAMERLGSAMAANRPVALLYLGVDNLRALSESGGPAFIDRLLQQIGENLQEFIRPGDTVAHLITDEFLVLLENMDGDNAVAMADTLQQVLLQPHRFGGHDVTIDCRIGIAAYPADGISAEELLSRAALAMKDAVNMPGRLQVYQHGRDLAHQRQIRLIRDLRRAATNGELSLHYQPKLDIRTQEVRQAEALLRWQHPEFAMVSPGEFIELAERTGSIQILTRWVIEEGIRQLAEWRQRGLHIQLSLNISAEDLTGGDLVERVTRLLKLHAVPAEQIIFEITESAIMREPTAALKVLNSLRSAGICLSVDDFGTGYSSLAHLKRLPVQELKIDQSFVRDLDETSEDAVIVRSTIEMSHNLGLKVVAEGVEYERSLHLLERWNCDTAQGYLISRPLTAQAFETWVRQPIIPSSALVH
jgi:diguanylate cyclase (GGDEF)-like protein